MTVARLTYALLPKITEAMGVLLTATILIFATLLCNLAADAAFKGIVPDVSRYQCKKKRKKKVIVGRMQILA